MSKYLWLTWDGAGNLPPSLAIAEELTRRGHQVSFAGRPEMIPRVKAAGFQAIEIKSAYVHADIYPKVPLGRMVSYLTSPAVCEELLQTVSEQNPDVVVIDCMFPAALSQIARYGRPTVMACYTFYHRMYKTWQSLFEEFISMREQAGLGRLPGVDELWRGPDRIVDASLEEFDQPVAAEAPKQVTHVGPILGGHRSAISSEKIQLPPGNDPLVLVSFSTTPMQNTVAKFQRALNALSSLPVRVVVTTAKTIDGNALEVPKNAVVVGYADHDALLSEASLLVTHGGHGTAMRTLKHGVPAVLIPGIAADQPVIAATFEEWGCGVGLPPEASVEEIHAAAKRILETPSFRKNAESRAKKLSGASDSVKKVADVFESLRPLE